MEGNEQLAVIIPMLQEVGRGIRDDQLEHRTPCADFDVAGVLAHMTGLATVFAPAFRGEAPPEVADSDFDQAMADLLAAVQSDGALARTVQTPGGAMAGAIFARLVALDGLVHGWDLASATSQPWNPPDLLVAEVDGFARQAITADMRSGPFAPAEPESDGMTAMEHLAAFTGRRIPA